MPTPWTSFSIAALGGGAALLLIYSKYGRLFSATMILGCVRDGIPSRSEKQESKQVKKSSAKERMERLFADKGIVGLKLGTSIVVHECLGVMLMAGTWGK
jgi:hypothetical protein